MLPRYALRSQAIYWLVSGSGGVRWPRNRLPAWPPRCGRLAGGRRGRRVGECAARVAVAAARWSSVPGRPGGCPAAAGSLVLRAPGVACAAGLGVCCPCRRFFLGSACPVISLAPGRPCGLGIVAACTPIRFGFSPAPSCGQPHRIRADWEGGASDGQEEGQGPGRDRRPGADW